MILSDRDILDRLESGDLEIEPIEDLDTQLQPASVDLRLGEEFLEFQRANIPYIHPDSEAEAEGYVEETTVPNGEEFILHPGDFVLGTTRERVDIPDDLVAHVEGRSSLGRLAIVVHASLPYDEELFLWTPAGGLGFYEIGEIVENERSARAVAFDPQTMEVSTHRVTDHITNPTKRIYRVRLQSGREVHVTRDHNLFTLDEQGGVTRVASEEADGSLVMVPQELPNSPTERHTLGSADTKSTAAGLVSDGGGAAPADTSRATTETDVPRECLKNTTEPQANPAEPAEPVNPADVPLTREFGVVVGCYLAAGLSHEGVVRLGPTDERLLDRVGDWFTRSGAEIDRQDPEEGGAYLTVQSPRWADRLAALETPGDQGDVEPGIPDEVWDWPVETLEGLLEGLEAADTDLSLRDGPQRRTQLHEHLPYLTGQVRRLQFGDVSTEGETVTDPAGEPRSHGGSAVSTTTESVVPVPETLLCQYREESGLTLEETTKTTGIETAVIREFEAGERSAATRRQLRRLCDRYATAGADTARLDQVLTGDVQFERVESVTATDRVEPTYDLEVQPRGRTIENFLGGRGGVFLSNTAGLCDPGYRGQITLELSNLGTAPVSLSPGMRVSQLTFTQLSSPADRPYGAERGSKYQDQDGPQASRIGSDPEFDQPSDQQEPSEIDDDDGDGPEADST